MSHGKLSKSQVVIVMYGEVIRFWQDFGSGMGGNNGGVNKVALSLFIT